MERLQVKAQIREGVGKGVARKARAQGLIPAVVYGVGQEPLPLTVNHHEFDKGLKGSESTNVLIELAIENGDTLEVMLRDYQVDVLSRSFLHVDFQKVDLSKKIKVEVPIHLVGTAPGVKEGGILEHIRRSLEVRCLPTAIPEAINVDVSQLNMGDTVHIHDIQLPEGVEITSTADVTVAAVVAPAAEKAETPEEGEAVAEPEVVGQKKAKEGEEAAAAPQEEKK